MGHDRHEIAGAPVSIEDGVIFPPHTAIDGVEDAVPQTSAGVDKESSADEALAGWRENNVDRVVHAARDDRFQSAPVGLCPEQVRCARCELRAVGKLMLLLR